MAVRMCANAPKHCFTSKIVVENMSETIVAAEGERADDLPDPSDNWPSKP